MRSLYSTTATATGDGRNGHVQTDDELLSLDLATPRSMGGPGGATNPEQLFASGYAACFLSALKFISKLNLKDTEGAEVAVTVGLRPVLKSGFTLRVNIAATLPKVQGEKAISLVRQAHHYCPYSNATKGNIEVMITANGEAVDVTD